jgi:FkbM family methyltransferase
MRRIINLALGKLGYQISKKSRSRSVFSDQARLISKIPAPVIFDCGAHVGATVIQYRRFIPNARILAFEPFPEAFRALQETTLGDEKIELFSLAISNKSGELAFNCNRLPQTNSLLDSDPAADAYWGAGNLDTRERIEVKAVSLDDFCKEARVERIDILKLDIQGGEYQALEGAGDMLESQKIGLVYAEMLMTPTYKGQRKFWEILGLLDQYGYGLFNLYHMHEQDGQLLQADAIFVSRPLRPHPGRLPDRAGRLAAGAMP